MTHIDLSSLHLDLDRIALAKERQCRFWRGEKNDIPPLLLTGCPLTPEQEKAFPNANYEEQWNDPRRMLCNELRGAAATANARSDAVPSVRANYGTAITLAAFGLEQTVYPDKMPWLLRHLSLEEASRFTEDDIAPKGSLDRALDTVREFKDALRDVVPIYVYDTQGPLGLVHGMLGEELFYAMADEPEGVHRLCGLCTELAIRATRWHKEITGEGEREFHHSNALVSDTVGIRVCDDVSCVIGGEMSAEFSMPYAARLARTFGGAFYHYCGKNEALTANALALPELRALNFGPIHGHEFDHDSDAEFERFAAAGGRYYGGLPRKPGESPKDHLPRLPRWARPGLLLPQVGLGTLTEDGKRPDPAAVYDFWASL